MISTASQPTADSAVDLDEAALDSVQGGGCSVKLKQLDIVVLKPKPNAAGVPGKPIDGVAFTAPGDVAG